MFRGVKSLLRPNVYRFATEAKETKALDKAKVKADANRLTFYQNGELTTRSAVTLKSHEDVESYVVKTVQNYFRTTYKDGTNSANYRREHQ